MNFSEREKIRRQIYKNEELKRRKEEQEKLKYPALNGLINENNILDYFIFDKDEEDDEENIFNNDINVQIEYEINSYLNNDEVPDLYTPIGMISGDNYKLIQTKRKNEENENNILNSNLLNNNLIDIQNIALNIENNLLNKECKNETKNEEINLININNKKKNIRYFDIDIDIINNDKDLANNPRCKKCGKIGHYKCDCTENTTFCYICLSNAHVRKNCPKTQRCYKCLKYGHISQNCIKNFDLICENCNICKHKKEECIKYADEITIKDIKKKELSCEFCGSQEHIICPFSQKKNYILLYEYKNNEKNKNNDINMNKYDFTKKLYCPICGENHLRVDCPDRKDYKAFSEKSEIKSVNSDTNNYLNNYISNNCNINDDDNWANDVIYDKKSGSVNTNYEKEIGAKKDINFKYFDSWGEIDGTSKKDDKNDNNNKDNKANKDNKDKNDNKNKNDNNDNKDIKDNKDNKDNTYNVYNKNQESIDFSTKRANSNYSNNNNNNNSIQKFNNFNNSDYYNRYDKKEYHKNNFMYNSRNKNENYRVKSNKSRSNFKYKKSNYNNYNNDCTNYSSKCISLKEEENNNFEYKNYKNNNKNYLRYNNNSYNNKYCNSFHNYKTYDIYEDYKNYKKKKYGS